VNSYRDRVKPAEEPDAWSSNLGLSRRRFVKRAALVGGTLVWATPVVQSIGSPAMAAGTKPNDISYLALLISRAGQWYRMKWETSPTGSLRLETGPRFQVPAAVQRLYPDFGNVEAGPAPGTSAAYNSDGSITVTLGSDCTLVMFLVKRGLCVAGPGIAGEPRTGQTGGTIRFPGPTSNRPFCA
jgi:hypothetical protein